MSSLRELFSGVRHFALMSPPDEGGSGAAGGATVGGAGGGAAGGTGGAAGGGAVKDGASAAAGGAGAAGGVTAGAGAGGAGAGAGGAAAGAGAGAAGAAGAAGGAAGAAPGTIAGGAATPTPGAGGKWPEAWRTELAGDDTAYLKTLERFDSPQALAKAYRELQGKVSSGDLKFTKAPPAADAKPEEIAAWRKDQGLPESADALIKGLKLPNGATLDAADQAQLKGLGELGMKANWTQGQFDAFAEYAMAQGVQQKLTLQKADGDFHSKSIVELTQEWGKQFEANQNAIGSLMRMLPGDVTESVLSARLPNGRMLGDDPQVLRGLLVLAKELNPASTVLPAAAGSGLTGVESRIAEIETKHMRAAVGSAEYNAYWQGDAGAKMQGEYRELLGAREKMKSRQAA